MDLHGSATGSAPAGATCRTAIFRARRSRRLAPQGFDILEDRQLLSSVVADSSSTASPTVEGFFHRSRPTGAATRGFTRELNVPFSTVDGGSERLDVYMPAGTPPAAGRPVLVAIHGGGWRRLDKAGYGSRIASVFVREGYVVVAPNYELSAPDKPTWPVNLEDVQAAVTWVRQNASSLGIDPNQIAAIGESAGANLAALVGTSSVAAPGGVPSSSAVQAVVAFSTPTDLTDLGSESPLAGWAAAQFLGGTPEQVPGNYTAASPIDHVSAGDPPMFLVQGREDPLIPYTQSVEMAAALTAAGVRNNLVLVTGGHDLDFPTHYQNLVQQILVFLDATWKDE
jgi:acetyl esterase/lipase